MSVPNQIPLTVHTGNAITTSFPYQFLLLATEDASVTVDGVPQTLGTQYTVTGLGEPSGGAVVFSTPPALNSRIVLRRYVSLARLVDYQYAGDFNADTINGDLDRLWMAIQDFSLDVAKSIRFPAYDTTNGLLPAAPNRAGRMLAFDQQGVMTLIPAVQGDAADLALELASSALSTQGAGMVGYRGVTVWVALDSLADAIATQGLGLTVHFKSGYVLGGRVVAALTEATVDAERLKLSTESMRVHNASQKHIVLTDGTREVVIAMTADGGARITAYAGTADENSLTIPRASAVPVVQGNRQNNAALQSTLRALESLGLIKDKTQ